MGNYLYILIIYNCFNSSEDESLDPGVLTGHVKIEFSGYSDVESIAENQADDSHENLVHN